MSRSAGDDAVAAAFEEHRGRLVAVAARMLGSRADAEDAVQEAWLRLSRQDPDAIDNLAGWLTTVVGRVCLDMLRARRARPEASYDDELPALVVTEDEDAAPEDEAVLGESVGLALTVVLDTLRPAERLAFVLHDLFAVPFEEIGQILDRSPDAAKMLASRARRKVQGSAEPSERHRQREVVDAFLAAARGGDLAALLRLLDPDVTWRSRTARGVIVKHGAVEVADRAARAVAHAAAVVRPVRVDGEAGIVVWNANGRPLAVMACTVVDAKIVAMRSVTDADRLAAMDLPEFPG
ncbi:sigma-70 family RNA polymerase sigma factor [Mumia sp. DW29H23]|uniref:sigma-70 family RNA polymerase sigma factor n=1 Tax=Mumia sp. DW29H23 TaxID=3421241 RepID=UPI003D6865F0